MKSAPGTLKEWQDKWAQKMNQTKKSKKDAKKGEHSDGWKNCTNPENMIISHCIRRQLILTCPTWIKAEKCDNLMMFAKSCSYYPIMECKKTIKEKKIEKKEKKEEKKKAKKTKKEEKDNEESE